jgi:mannan endo-1,4-beta-mannosidase
MITLPRIAMMLLLLIAGYVFVVAPWGTAVMAQSHPPEQVPVADGSPEPVPTFTPGPATVFPPAGKAFFGIFTRSGGADLKDYDRFVAATGRQPQVMLFAQGWAVHTFSRTPFDRLANRGMLPILGWEPWDYRTESNVDSERGTQPRYRLARIAAGDFDSYLTSWANGIKGLGYRVGIRFAHEMNGYWYPWCEQANGNRPGDYVAAWRHVHDLFHRAGADNVTWIWSPNVSYTNSTPLAGLYPGDGYVDWVGLSGYYGTGGHAEYRTFEQVFMPTVKEVRAFTRRPIVLTEVAATDRAGRKAEWLRDLLRTLPRHPDIIGFIWYEVVKETDWRIAASATASSAFAAGVSQPYFDVRWSPGSVART